MLLMCWVRSDLKMLVVIAHLGCRVPGVWLGRRYLPNKELEILHVRRSAADSRGYIHMGALLNAWRLLTRI